MNIYILLAETFRKMNSSQLFMFFKKINAQKKNTIAIVTVVTGLTIHGGFANADTLIKTNGLSLFIIIFPIESIQSRWYR
jgi:hypothetical protein